MDNIKLSLRRIRQDNVLEIEGINFTNCAFIEIYINERLLFDLESFYGSFVYLKELKLSAQGSGNFLIFTSVSGIADDAGWDFIQVTHKDDMINWQFTRDEFTYSFTFSKFEYINEIQKIENEIIASQLKIEPVRVIYPE